jgi:flagellar biosynthesis protein FlgN
LKATVEQNQRLDPMLARQHMEQLLVAEANNLEHLEKLLAQEHELLLGSDLEALDHTGNARQACIAELLRIDDERRSLCRMLGFEADAEGLRRLLLWCDPANGLLTRWNGCLQKATKCRMANDQNGALVTAKLKRVEGLLGVLTGRDSSTAVYSAQGSYTRQSPGHTLAQA